MIDPLIRAFANSNLPLTSEEIADVIWLASYMDTPTGASALADQPDFVSKPPTQPATPPHPANDEQSTRRNKSSSSDQAEIHLPKPSMTDQHRIDGVRAMPFRSPAATALPGKLALMRSLRPIFRKILSSTLLELDEVATAEQAAEAGQITPQLRPSRERWLDVAVLIDDWHTMSLWQQTIAEWIELLQQLGTFRTLQSYLLHTKIDPQTKQATLHLTIAQGATFHPSFQHGRSCHPGELSDPLGRRLLLVLTDCTSPAWSSGAAGELLSTWGRSNRVALVQMLPADLWDSSALSNAIQVAVSATAPGMPNAKLTVERPWYWEDIWDEERTPASLSQPIPVVTLEPETLRRWAQVIVSKGGNQAAAFYLPLQPLPTSSQNKQIQVETPSPEELWRRFRANASPLAQELAGYLSAAPLNLPVMRLVQRVMLPQSRQVHLAEVLRSRLIERVTPDDRRVEPDEVRYEFMDGVRELLLTTVLLSDTKMVLEKVSEYISNHDHSLRNFHALILDPTSVGNFVLGKEYIPFAKVTATVLHRLGGQFVTIAEQLKNLGAMGVHRDAFLERGETVLPYQQGLPLSQNADIISPVPVEPQFLQIDQKLYPMTPNLIHTQLSTILSHLYATRADLERVAHDAGVPLDRVAFGSSSINDWNALLREASKQQGVAALLDVAMQEYAQNRELLDAMVLFKEFKQTTLLSSLPTNNIHLLNFARELTTQQQQEIEIALGQRVFKVVHLPARFDDARPYGPQCVALAEQVGLTAAEWHSLPIVVNPPGFTPVALSLLSVLHGRIGYFPSVVRMRPIVGVNPTQFEVAEIINLQALRNAARDHALIDLKADTTG